MKQILFIFIFSISNYFFSQININYSNNPIPLMSDKLNGSGVTISNINYGGNETSIGTFSADINNFNISEGIVLTTGDLNNLSILGPNDKQGEGVNLGMVGSDHLSSLINNTSTYDAVVIGFDIIPDNDNIILNYIFASEEFPEFYQSIFNDIMGIFISGPGYDTLTNIAKNHNDQIICVNNVYEPAYPAFYIENGDGTQAPYNNSNKFIEFDGFTSKIQAYATTIPGENYKLYIIVADANDGIYNSAVFIEANSVTSSLENNFGLVNSNIFITPNPINQFSKINFELSRSSIVTYEIFNGLGKKIGLTNDLGILNEGKHNINLENDNLTTGIYFIHITVNNHLIIKKVVK